MTGQVSMPLAEWNQTVGLIEAVTRALFALIPKHLEAYQIMLDPVQRLRRHLDVMPREGADATETGDA